MRNLIFSLLALSILLFLSCEGADTSTNHLPILQIQSYGICEDAYVGFLIGTVRATDQDGDNVSFSILNTEDDLFEIDSLSGELKLVGILDFETTASHTLTIRATDGQDVTEEDFTVSVLDVDETTAISSIIKNWYFSELVWGDPEPDWSDLQVSFTKTPCRNTGTFSSSGVPEGYEPVWPSSGTWEEDDDQTNYIIRSDDNEILIFDVNDNSLSLVFTIKGSGGRIEDLYDNPWQFKFSDSQ